MTWEGTWSRLTSAMENRKGASKLAAYVVAFP